MRKENIEFLEAQRHHYNTLVNAGYVQHLDQATRQRMLDVIHEEFNPGYIGTLWCPPCVADMIKYVYVQYEKWIVANKATEPVDQATEPVAETMAVPTVEPERDHVRITFPIQEEPATEDMVQELNQTIYEVPEEMKQAITAPKIDGTLFGQQKGNTKPITDSKPVGAAPPKPASKPTIEPVPSKRRRRIR